MASLQDILEAYRNYRGVNDWRLGRQEDQMLGHSEQARGLWDLLQGVGVGDVAGIGAIKVYHGSPHLFDKFDMSKIGTGEGAQAYGHGLYFAEHPNVATDYANELAERYGDVISVGNHEIGRDDWRFGPAAFIKQYLENGYDLPRFMDAKEATWAQRVYDRGIPVKIVEPHIYETSLEWPDRAREATDPMGPQHFLDWDRPLSEQPDLVQNAWAKFTKKYPAYLNPELSGGQYKQPTGRDFYSAIFEETPGMGEQARAKVTARLKKERIPGIRYLDQGSRGAGDGTYNYVVFDDQIPRIVARNGVPVKGLMGMLK